MGMDSTSRVKVEYTDPDNIFHLFAESFTRRLPLKDLHWSSASRPTRSISNLHVELIPGQQRQPAQEPSSAEGSSEPKENGTSSRDDGGTKERRHQIPGLRQTPYLKIYFLHCDDIESYRSTARKSLREWVKSHTPSQSTPSLNKQDNHDAFEWLIIHVISPPPAGKAITAGPHTIPKNDGDAGKRPTSSRWPSRGSTSVIEKVRSDFNVNSKNGVDRVAQVHVANVSADDATQSDQPREDGMIGWDDLISKLKARILASFDMRVSQYEDEIKEKEGQKHVIGWNFNTFFVLKEGLAMGFESMGLLDDALIVYRELAFGLGKAIDEQHDNVEQRTAHFEDCTEDTYQSFKQAGALNLDERRIGSHNKPRAVDVGASILDFSRKSFRTLILSNKISIFDFQCYLFARQTTISLRLAHAMIYHVYLINSASEQRDSGSHIGYSNGDTFSGKLDTKEPENLILLVEIVRSAIEFIVSTAVILRRDILQALTYNQNDDQGDGHWVRGLQHNALENFIDSWIYSACQTILHATSARYLSAQIGPFIRQLTPKSTNELGHAEGAASKEEKAVSPRELPLRTSSLSPRNSKEISSVSSSQAPSSMPSTTARLLPPGNLHPGAQDLASARGDLIALQRRILTSAIQGRNSRPASLSEPLIEKVRQDDLHDVELDEETEPRTTSNESHHASPSLTTVAGFCNETLITASQANVNFNRINEVSAVNDNP